MLEDDGRQRDEKEAAEEDEEHRGDHTDLRLTHVPLLWWGRKG